MQSLVSVESYEAVLRCRCHKKKNGRPREEIYRIVEDLALLAAGVASAGHCGAADGFRHKV